MHKKLQFSITLITLLLISCTGDVSSQTSFESSSSNTYTVAFDSRGGSIVPNQIVEQNSFISPPNVSKEGHNLEGWYTSLNDGVTLENKWNFLEDRVNFDFTLYASWIINQYTILFESNGGNQINSITANYGANLTTPSPSKAGYTFAGWFTDVGLTQAFTLTTMPAQNITLFATWTINQYTITFETNGGTSIASITGNYGDAVLVPSDPTREGYTFNGWYADANLTQTATVPNAIPAQNLTLYAKWIINQYTITFETNSGNSIQTQTNNYNSSLSIPNATRVGHSFGGWYTDVGLTQAFTLTTMPAQNITLFATWTINQYTITFETNGGTSIASITGNYGDAVLVPSDPTREGYTFNGWYADANLTQTATVPNAIPAQNLTFYAGWTINQYTLTFESNGGSVIPSITINYDDNLNILTPTKEVHSFGGWFTDVGLTQAFTLTTMPASNLTLYAKWTINQYTITFETNGGSSIASITGNYGDAVLVPSNPTREDNTFNGWYADANLTQTATVPNAIPAQNLTFYAGWTTDGIQQISLGENHSSALSSHGRVFMWGYNGNGQLGNGTENPKNIPIDITLAFSLTAGDKIISLSLGSNHSSALSSNGRVFMWGNNGHGNLGDDTFTARSTPIEITSAFSLTGGDKIISLSLGSNNSSALSSHGRVFMWGYNGNGQLGNGSTTNIVTPTEITSAFSLTAGDKIISLSLGFYHSSALSSNGRVFMWGNNGHGNLGDDTFTAKSTPTEITSAFSLTASDKIISLSLGSNHSSALSSHGRVFMWGYNYDGQSGDGTTTIRNVPTEITSRFSLATGDKIIFLSLGESHSSALSSNGRVFMWGYNNNGQLGNGSTTNIVTPTEITSAFSLTSSDKIISLSLGSNHSSALSSHGRVFMWGSGFSGKLAFGWNISFTFPIEISVIYYD